MRLDYINPFVEAASSVLEEVLNEPVKEGRVSLSSGLTPKSEFAVCFGLTGDVKGEVLFDMDVETAIKITALMNDTTLDSMDPIVMDSIAELMNIIMGKSVTIINNKGFNFYFTPPMVFTGKELNISTLDIETLVVPVETKYGTLVVNVALVATI